MKRSWTYWGMAVGALAGACGGKTEDSSATVPPPEFETGVVESKVLGELSEAERIGWCQSVQSTIREYMQQPVVQEGFCRFAGAFAAAFAGGDTDAAVQEACFTTYDACMSGGETDESGTDECVPPSASCQVTAAEAEACMAAAVAQTNDLFRRLPACEHLTADDVQITTEPTAEDTVEDPPECAAVRERCPELLESAQPDDEEF